MNLHNPEEVLNALCKLQSVANETIKYAEEQETKRVEINAKKDVAIEKIKTIERCIKDYLEKLLMSVAQYLRKNLNVLMLR